MKPNIGASSVFALLCTLTISGTADAAAILPDFGSATFTGAAPDNPYFPMRDGQTRTYVARQGNTVVEKFVMSNLGLGPVLLGVQTFIQRDRAFEGSRIAEDTLDYFAQDTDGNVWYMGEDVTNYLYDENGVLQGTNTASSWLAGINGALPGFIMPVALTVGFNYYQEFAEIDEAIDQGTINGLGLFVDGYENVVRVLETNPLNPASREFKYYAQGIGLIRSDEALDPNLENPELTFHLVPEPPLLALFGLGLAGLGVARRRRRA